MVGKPDKGNDGGGHKYCAEYDPCACVGDIRHNMGNTGAIVLCQSDLREQHNFQILFSKQEIWTLSSQPLKIFSDFCAGVCDHAHSVQRIQVRQHTRADREKYTLHNTAQFSVLYNIQANRYLQGVNPMAV